MHRASLRTKLVKTCTPHSRVQPSPQTQRSALATQALFCQSGIKWTGEKQGAGFEERQRTYAD
ncbi:MAG: hypothetical protein KME32_04140 [Mojavia pulchra JT2-VF2]|jgi:hypothetical protein|uniref:Uncharacterized protein n=1 Tax=Mojavia pulchra JT2-VF2 TaxID=287848 RepID=A0A951UEL9_9NOST|nr:hypothetical protein [Mojavia pulchra JT2-VF2]